MFGIQDVPDGSSQVALDALKAELAKSSEVAAEFSPNDKEELRIDNIHFRCSFYSDKVYSPSGKGDWEADS